MPRRISANIQLFIRKIFSKLEIFFHLAKNVLSERNFIYLSCVAVAISCAFAVIFLKTFAHSVFVWANYVNKYLKLPYSNSILPIVGILLTVFVIKRFLGGNIEKGSARILHSIARKGGIIPRKQMYAQIITSSLTVGLGGSAGLESPIVITGAAFGSNYAQNYLLSKKNRILLLACGVAAGIGAAFNAPIAGVLFAIEVILADISISAFIPIMISAATGALVSKIMLSGDVILSFEQEQSFDFRNTPFYILLGILAGFISIYHARTFRKAEHYISHLSQRVYVKAIIGALFLAVLIFFFPTLFGEGYESIKTLSTAHPEALLENTLLENFKNEKWVLLLFVGVIVFIKSIATGITLGSGGNGGNFAPSLFVGSYLGFFVAKTSNLIGLTSNLPVTNFTIVGMAGILSGLFHAPLTAIFLIGEITGGYDLMIPLMIVSSISFAISKRFEEHSMDVKALAHSGDVFTSDKDKNILQSIDVLKLIDTNVETLDKEDSLDKLVVVLSEKKQQIFPVLDDKKLIGIVDFDDIRSVIFNTFQVKHTKIEEIMKPVSFTIYFEDDIENIMNQFETANSPTLPVIKNKKFYGLLSKNEILENYRSIFKNLVID
ncbi:chloride channel protein [Flavobacterium sp. H122]|uniref:chloride channel protein n=1 Tax=Flavobacterium sp. H122 TaxID=2529860 RepID=UPI0010AB031C|nr:chloride channel protein [Flavobacterium sp. H122]